MKRENFNHGFTQTACKAAKEEARKAMIAVACREDLIACSDLPAHIASCTLEPHDPRLAGTLVDLSTEEDEADRGMLSAKPWSIMVTAEAPLRLPDSATCAPAALRRVMASRRPSKRPSRCAMRSRSFPICDSKRSIRELISRRSAQ